MQAASHSRAFASEHLRRSHAIEFRPIASLRPFTKNARTHSKKQLRLIGDSIKAFGFTNPVLIDENGVILAGHGRVEAAKSLGFESVPAMILSGMSEAQKRAYVLADNRIAEKAGWDRELLASELGVLVDLLPMIDLDVSITGFEIGEIDMLLEDFTAPKADPADELPPLDARKAPVTRAGDLWLLGNHRLLCGDVRDEDAVVRLMDGAEAEMVFTDPPYNVKIDGNAIGRGKIRHREFAMASGEMSAAEFTLFLTTALGNLASASKDGAIHFICMDWRHMGELLAAGDAVYSELKNLCVWTKTNAGQGSFYRSQHELVFAFKKGEAEHINSFGLGAGTAADAQRARTRAGESARLPGAGRNRANVWTYPGVNSFGSGRLEQLALHPTVKPVAMVADAMRDCSTRGGVVLDGFSGSGTLFLAAEKVGRRGYGVEIDPLYVDVAITRWQKMTGKDAVHAESGETFDERAASVELKRERGRA
ncbi:DNA methyltransferase [Methylosinus sp. KRF6]|uniref:site-specific DNA-methyltransferase n=1 Tax=Methylosinus sp. KRF6 TaxID=2846853 RepID=UPI001C0DCC15|nr:DNA methyltransferase [Methylosinus sp. KRF6]MBU3888570.1 ParB N-terminal domain-containing protein [Methylosinus sp. KRF6]